MPMEIQVNSVTKKFGRAMALEDITFRIEPGQIVSILGANGAGKTTLLRCLAGFLTPTKGHVYMDGQKLARSRLELRRRFLFLPDFPFLFWNRNILENIGILMKLYEVPTDGVEDSVIACLRELNLLPYSLANIGTLSRGQVYKSALAGLFAANPEVWMLDEPFASGMDPDGISVFKRRARELTARGGTVIYSTQILDIAERFSDRVCVINRGRLHAFDSMTSLQTSMGTSSGVLEELFRRLREEGGSK